MLFQAFLDHLCFFSGETSNQLIRLFADWMTTVYLIFRALYKCWILISYLMPSWQTPPPPFCSGLFTLMTFSVAGQKLLFYAIHLSFGESIVDDSCLRQTPRASITNDFPSSSFRTYTEVSDLFQIYFDTG